MDEKALEKQAIIDASSPRTLEEVVEASEREEIRSKEGEIEYVR